MPDADVRLGLIGCGRRAPSWPRTIKATPGCRLTALCDRVAPRLRRIKELAGGPAVREYTDHRELLDDPEVDAVIVSVEPEVQAGLAAEAMEAGKDVVSEVPAAFNLDECWHLVLTAERTGKLYYLAEQIRHTVLCRHWRHLVQSGVLGSILFVEGHYLHAMAADRAWRDPETGEQLTWEQARNAPRKTRTRLWNMRHPILYGPHELSPLLKVIDDRVVSVSCFSTGAPSKRYREVPFPGMDMDFPIPDLEVALMQTTRGTVVRFAAGFQAPVSEAHWHHILGTTGEVETRRGPDETGYAYTFPDPVLKGGEERVPRTPVPWFHAAGQPPPDILAEYDADLPFEARQTGHGGADAYPLFDFVRCLREGAEPDIDVYTAVETAAPCVIAAQSAEQGGARLTVPDFRPGAHRRVAEDPVRP